jgi:hypothetical protein
MNIRLPSLNALRTLLASGDPESGNHILWIDDKGKVYLTRLRRGMTPVGFQHENPQMIIRFETFSFGVGAVGPRAANDDVWVNKLFSALLKAWEMALGRSDDQDALYVDIY